MTLWFFRTPAVHSGGMYGVSTRELKEHELRESDANYWRPTKTIRGVSLFHGNKKPRGFPPLDPGECIPVKLVAEGKGVAKKGRK